MTIGSTVLGGTTIEGPSARVREATFIVLAIAGCVLLQLNLVFTQAINWDEFRFLADVHRYARGELAEPLQTFHVHLFGWLLWLPFDEIGQIIAARLAMLVVECGTIGMIYGCARRFMPIAAALMAALCYASFSFVIAHGASFRFDPLSIGLLMAAAWLLLNPRSGLGSMLVAGAAVAVAGLITIKSAFMVPTLAVAMLGRVLMSTERSAAAAQAIASVAACVAASVLLYALHQASLASAGWDTAQGLIAHSAEKTLGHGGLLPEARTALRAVAGNVAVWLLVGIGLVRTIVAVRRRGRERLRAAMLLAFALPLLTPLFYRNAYPYYYAWMMAPAALLAGAGACHAAIARRSGLVAILLLGTALLHHSAVATPVLSAQRATLAAIHAMFPAPVAYIDRASMVGSFRKVGPFMSRWGLENYRADGRPIMRDLLRTHAPPLLVANSPVLEAALVERSGAGIYPPLLPADIAVLRENYIHHWGALWVAGQRFALTSAAQQFEILIPGPYRIESRSAVAVDATVYRPGDVVMLSAGSHLIASHGAAQPALLRWGSRLIKPTGAPPAHPLFASL